jgi:O-antigen/teichoic acid export membrane protein
LAEKEHDGLQRLYTQALRLILLVAPPCAVALSVFAKPFLTLWAGAEFGRESVVPFYLLLVGLIFSAANYVPFNLVMAAGRSDMVAKCWSAELIPYLLLAAALTYWLGANGAALAWSLRITLDALVYFVAAQRITSVRFAPLNGRWRLYGGAVAVLCLPFLLSHGGWEKEIARGVALLFAMTCYAAVGWRWLLLDEEKAWLKRQFEQMRQGLGCRAQGFRSV